MEDDQYSKWRCALFYSIVNTSMFIYSKEAEQLEYIRLNDIQYISHRFIDNIPCLINFAIYYHKTQYRQNVFVELNYTEENY